MIIIVDAHDASVEKRLRGLGLWTRRYGPSPSTTTASPSAALWTSPSSTPVAAARLKEVPGVLAVLEAESPHPLLDAMSRSFSLAPGVDVVRGGRVLCAGPCSVESAAQIDRIAGLVKAQGAHVLRGGAWKPRTSPHGFQGKGEEALSWLASAARRHGLAAMTEVVSEADVEHVAPVVDVIQVGARAMHAHGLLRVVGQAKKPVVLKRAFSASLEEWLLAGEALLLAGAPSVVFCERGVRGPDGGARNVLDVGAIAVLTEAYGLPVFVDPSHAAGRRDIVIPLANAGLAAGACGVVIEVHDRPEDALSDAPQAIDPALLARLAGPRT